MNKIMIPAILVMAFLSGGCSSQQEVPTTHGVYMLLDTSGTYTEELNKAQLIINYTLAKLNPGDTFAVARVDTGSFSEKDIVAKVTFDDRPSMANRQKLKFRDDIDRFVKTVKPSAYTDITGGMLQAIEYLNEAGVGKKTVLIFSDLKEELKKGYVRDIPLQVGGFDVVALNVTKLRSDNIDPREYMDRLSMWQARVQSGEGTWRVINDMERLESVVIN
jgi:hypothetical protein